MISPDPALFFALYLPRAMMAQVRLANVGYRNFLYEIRLPKYLAAHGTPFAPIWCQGAKLTVEGFASEAKAKLACEAEMWRGHWLELPEWQVADNGLSSRFDTGHFGGTVAVSSPNHDEWHWEVWVYKGAEGIGQPVSGQARRRDCAETMAKAALRALIAFELEHGECCGETDTSTTKTPAVEAKQEE